MKTSLESTFKSENVPGSFKIRGTCTINLSIAQIDRLHRPTVLSVSCNAHYNPINISSTIININIIHSHIIFPSIIHNIFPQHYSPKSQIPSNSFSILTTSQITIITIHLQIYHTIPKYLAPPDRILHICVKIFYIKIIVFERHPIA